jgi:hypothetical protein
MKISTKELDLEIEPKLLTDEGLKRMQQLLNMALEYEKARMEAEALTTRKSKSAPAARKKVTLSA